MCVWFSSTVVGYKNLWAHDASWRSDRIVPRAMLLFTAVLFMSAQQHYMLCTRSKCMSQTTESRGVIKVCADMTLVTIRETAIVMYHLHVT